MFGLNVNMKTRAATQFMDYPFNSFCNFKGRRLAAGPDGLFSLGGDTDAGTTIEAFIETLLSSWGSQNVKRPRFCYLSFLGDKAKLSVIDGDLNVQAAQTITAQSPTLPEVRRIPMPRTVAQRFWKFKIENVAGSDFSVDGLSVFFTIRPSGLSRGT